MPRKYSECTVVNSEHAKLSDNVYFVMGLHAYVYIWYIRCQEQSNSKYAYYYCIPILQF